MSHLASIGASSSTSSSSSSFSASDPQSPVVCRVLESNPLLEAFGNAKTVRNDNSSRFGKYTRLQFAPPVLSSSSTMPLCGSVCDVYLLEKSRVTCASPGERVYHIFYQILSAPEETKRRVWRELENKSGKDFEYVQEGGMGAIIEGETDGEKFERTSGALRTLAVPDETIDDLLRGICVCMQFGNVAFEESADGNDDGSSISTPDHLSSLASLLGVPAASLEKALTFRTMTASADTYSVPLTPSAAREGRDAFAKELYQRLFLWLVKSINKATAAPAESAKYGIIGLLDIFGFESFKINRFEQLCINWCNEKLQQKFTVDVFRSVVQVRRGVL